MKVKPGYKQTEVGVIPEDWDCALIANVARLESGHTPSKRKPSYWGGSVQWVSLHDTALLDSREISATTKTITEDGINHSSARLLPQGTVVFSRTATVGKSTVMATSMATSQDFANYICGPDLDNYFLVYLFRSMGRTWQRLMAGSIHNTIYMPVFKALKIALPPLPEQRAIAAALSDVDALLAGLDRLIAKKRDLKQAAMQQLLTGQTRLPGFSGEWEMKTLGELAEIISGGTPKTTEPSYWNGGIKWCTPTDITGCTDKYLLDTQRTISLLGLKSSGARLLPADSLLLCSRATIGELKIAGGEICTNQGFKSLVCKPEVSNEFLYYKLLTMKQQMIERAFGSTFLEISKANVASLEVPLPSLPEQTAIAAVLSDMDAELSLLAARRDKTRDLKQAMMQELLTGRIRLV